ncbi:MAG TPA: DUF4332 domain-containing protein [Trichocoleus sp.]
MDSRSWNLHDLPGMTAQHEQQLAQIGIQTTAQLLQRSRNLPEQQNLARQLHLPLRYILKWVALADLARIPSVGCQYNGLLLHAGIISVSQLAQTAMGNLHPRLRRFYAATLSRCDDCPRQDQVALWIREARQIAAR